MPDTSSSNDTHRHPNLSSISKELMFSHCLITTPSSSIFIIFFVTYILVLLPLCTLIISFGRKQWWHSSPTSTAAVISHSDCITYHMVFMELMCIFGFILCCCGILSTTFSLISVGYLAWGFTWSAQMFFQSLICVEHYIAVVHPITYMGLRTRTGIKIRNICIGCVWIICSVLNIMRIFKNVFSGFEVFLLSSSLFVISFCGVSVLCALIRPGPGEQRADRERADQSKQRAFRTILVILGVLLLQSVWGFARTIMHALGVVPCMVMVSGIWLNLPGSVVLPVLFLYRTGILVCCKKAM